MIEINRSQSDAVHRMFYCIKYLEDPSKYEADLFLSNKGVWVSRKKAADKENKHLSEEFYFDTAEEVIRCLPEEDLKAFLLEELIT